jgi:hypothetical protein
MCYAARGDHALNRFAVKPCRFERAFHIAEIAARAVPAANDLAARVYIAASPTGQISMGRVDLDG